MATLAEEVPTEEVRTLYITQLPIDVKPREVENLCRPYPGFEHATLSLVAGKPAAFILFRDAASAIATREILNGYVFDSDLGVSLKVVLAKANTKPKRTLLKRPRDDATADADQPQLQKRTRSSHSYLLPTQAAPPALTAFSAPAYSAPAYAYDPYAGYGGFATPAVNVASSAASYGYTADPYASVVQPERERERERFYPAQSSSMGFNSNGGGSNPPCNTLFFGNMSATTSEQELRDLVSRFAGFRRIKVMQKESGLVAWVDFSDLSSSTQCLSGLQGYQLASSRSGPLRIEFAKSNMGTPRGGAGGGASGGGSGSGTLL